MADRVGFQRAETQPWNGDLVADHDEAEQFIVQFFRESPTERNRGGEETMLTRLAHVHADIELTGTYWHTPNELAFGARLAWRNSSRCIGRLYWNSLVVRDRRRVTGADGIYAELVDHLRFASGSPNEPGYGHIRPTISVFAPSGPDRPAARIWNEQLIRYAGYRQPDGTVTGDPRYVAFTTAMQRLGWTGPGGGFDVLPLVIESPTDGLRLFRLPADAVAEVELTHPEFDWFAAIGLRWHAVPAISNMRLSIGGVQYPLAPFNGWYMGAEIGARNLVDPDRYNLLPIIAVRMGLDTSRESTLWRDRALVEMNRAVLWSFEQAGFRITDHHTESARFLAHLERERAAGRDVPADWSWIVPPISGGLTPVFHRYYTDADQRPNFYLDDDARELGRTGRPGGSAAPAIPAQRCPVEHS